MANNTMHSFRDLKRTLQVNPNNFTTNGEDHLFLNPYSGPRTGCVLSLEWTVLGQPIQYPTLGKFNSGKNLWFWMTTSGHPDALRTVRSGELNRIQRQTVSPTDPTPLYTKGPNVTNFRAIVMVGKYLQLRRMQDLEFLSQKQMEIPWMIYKTEPSGGLKSLTKYSEWYCKAIKDIYELVVRELQTGSDSIANGELHKVMLQNNCLDVRTSVYPYTKELLATIVKKAPTPPPPPKVEPPKEAKPFKKKRNKRRHGASEGEIANAVAGSNENLNTEGLPEDEGIHGEGMPDESSVKDMVNWAKQQAKPDAVPDGDTVTEAIRVKTTIVHAEPLPPEETQYVPV